MQVIVQLRGEVNMSQDVRDTLTMLNLGRVNHATFVPETEAYEGMVKKIAEFAAIGEPSPEVVATVIRRRGEPAAGSESIDDEWVEAHTEYADVESLAAALIEEETTMQDAGLSPTLRLHPPRGGHDGIKHMRRNGGALGVHETDEIDALLRAMR